MKFEDLSEFDLELIRSMVLQKLMDKPGSRVHFTVEAVFECIHAKGYRVIRDPEKVETWSKPKTSWYRR